MPRPCLGQIVVAPRVPRRPVTIFLRPAPFAPCTGAPCCRGFADDAIEALLNYDWPGNIRQLQNAIERACVLAETDLVRLADLPAEIIRAERAVQEVRRSRRSKPGGDSDRVDLRKSGDAVGRDGRAISVDEHLEVSSTYSDGADNAVSSQDEPAQGASVAVSDERPESGARVSLADALLRQHDEGFDTLPRKMTALEKDRLQTALARSGGNKAAAARSLGMPRATLLYKLKKHGVEWKKER